MNATTRQRCAVIVYIIYIVIITGLLHAQTLTGPTQSEPGALFVVDAAVPADGGAVYRLTFDPAAVQFMGLVAPTPEVQQTGDSTLELSPDKGKAGIGLAVARRIAEKHGGTLEVSNGRDRGALAEVRLPLGG